MKFILHPASLQGYEVQSESPAGLNVLVLQAHRRPEPAVGTGMLFYDSLWILATAKAAAAPRCLSNPTDLEGAARVLGQWFALTAFSL